jgi:hypothetical protein
MKKYTVNYTLWVARDRNTKTSDPTSNGELMSYTAEPVFSSEFGEWWSADTQDENYNETETRDKFALELEDLFPELSWMDKPVKLTAQVVTTIIMGI